MKALARFSHTLLLAALGCNAPADLQNGGDAVTASPGAPTSPAAPGTVGEQGSAKTLALATSLPAQCSGPEILRIDRPVSVKDPSMGHYSYGYRFKAPTKRGAPVLVFLPGGPGSTSTDQVPDLLPDGWGYLLTDPRGVGCNALAAVPSPDVSATFFSTEEISDDVIGAIQDRHLDNYVLYGLSYGTQLGTWVAHGVEAQGVTPPRGVVLEAVLGRAFRPDEVLEPLFIDQWEKVRATLPADVLQEFDTSEAPFGIAASDWTQALTMGILGGPAVLGPTLSLLSKDNPVDDVRTGVIDQLRQLSTPFDHFPVTVEMYEQIACREIFPGTPDAALDLHFASGHLVQHHPGAATTCAPGFTLSDPYDSAKLQFSTKLYYFMGSDDTECTPAQGNYHFEHHQGPAVRVLTLKGGHASLEVNHMACATDILESIADGGDDLEIVLSLCPTNVDVKVDSK